MVDFDLSGLKLKSELGNIRLKLIMFSKGLRWVDNIESLDHSHSGCQIRGKILCWYIMLWISHGYSSFYPKTLKNSRGKTTGLTIVYYSKTQTMKS